MRPNLQTDAQLQLLVRTMTYLEVRHGAEQIQRHVGNLGHVAVTVAHRHTTDHHVSVADCLHLIRY